MKLTLFWFRRDLRLEDNTALNAAMNSSRNVLPLFIFDDNILEELPDNDPRVNFIYDTLSSINQRLSKTQSSILILKGKPKEVWKKLIKTYDISSVYINRDYEQYAIERDENVAQLLVENGIEMLDFKDQVIHEKSEVMKADGSPYTIFTPYKNKWLKQYMPTPILPEVAYQKFHKEQFTFPKLEDLGFKTSTIRVKPFSLENLYQYEETRNFPSLDTTSYLSPHLRFGTISIRQIIALLKNEDNVFLSELIWREFFMQILFHYPKVVIQNFRSKYDGIQWLNNESDFEKWCNGQTGYPLVDAGMRELNATGYMHNRVRMVTAGFLCKHLLIDWRWGEAYFAKKLLDYELSSNNGNWQWAAGTGCDAAPYFRIFNPIEQLKKFDKDRTYIKKWIPELDSLSYCDPIIEHKQARTRALETYKSGINN
ncbi:deoxyribodipyrimidine photo-lyase [Ancylomarina sp. 16SWW S1-10-2]|uniref:cryptochrome/photolyase family protein n=1 Tax=Ancylomarina sp. 16SWW S1-10-2 TaxID=2499681 RepID=UPI0012AE840B|nr:deoxyribodipyrimidine photo-lyase [Ancylomarina sp. 16SWW S1-10-2]MRT93752.1 deoxyribodipyrimidine photo-lyase [Ancylomarina sp. 16SWW S1-10-2]